MVGLTVISDETITISQGVLFARPTNTAARWSFSHAWCRDDYVEKKKDLQQSLLLITEERVGIRLRGEWLVEMLSISTVTTLLSFLDFHAKHRHGETWQDPAKEKKSLMYRKRSLTIITDENKTFRGAMMSAILNPRDSQFERVFHFIRNREDYWVSYFLLSQMMNNEDENTLHKINCASKRYGVSESYFRKLCYRAFTRSPKKQLRLWRAARSVLHLIEQDDSISTIAGNNGYASSSHFSSEIKSHFGITPREFRKIGKHF